MAEKRSGSRGSTETERTEERDPTEQRRNGGHKITYVVSAVIATAVPRNGEHGDTGSHRAAEERRTQDHLHGVGSHCSRSSKERRARRHGIPQSSGGTETQRSGVASDAARSYRRARSRPGASLRSAA